MPIEPRRSSLMFRDEADCPDIRVVSILHVVALICAHLGQPGLLTYWQTGLEAAALAQWRGGLAFSELSLQARLSASAEFQLTGKGWWDVVLCCINP